MWAKSALFVVSPALLFALWIAMRHLSWYRCLRIATRNSGEISVFAATMEHQLPKGTIKQFTARLTNALQPKYRIAWTQQTPYSKKSPKGKCRTPELHCYICLISVPGECKSCCRWCISLRHTKENKFIYKVHLFSLIFSIYRTHHHNMEQVGAQIILCTGTLTTLRRDGNGL